jgi:phosphoglucomutase
VLCVVVVSWCTGFKVYLFDKLAATPLVPYAVLLKKAAAGVMITASHNPKDDNGYKVNSCAHIIGGGSGGRARCLGGVYWSCLCRGKQTQCA